METKDHSDEQFFEIISIERSDDGNFEAVLEVSESGKNGPGITEKDIKCLEEEMKKERNNDDNNFSAAVLKFQEAVEQYSKSICDRLPKCMLDDEYIQKEVEQRKNESEIKKFVPKSVENLNNEASENDIESSKNSRKNTNDEGQRNHQILKEFVLLLSGLIFLVWSLFPDFDNSLGNYFEESVSNVIDGYIELTKLSDVPLRK